MASFSIILQIFISLLLAAAISRIFLFLFMSLPTHNHTLASHSMGQLSSMKAFSSHASFFLSSVCQHENTSFVRDFCVFFFCSCPVFKPQNSPGREEEIRMNCQKYVLVFWVFASPSFFFFFPAFLSMRVHHLREIFVSFSGFWAPKRQSGH